MPSPRASWAQRAVWVIRAGLKKTPFKESDRKLIIFLLEEHWRARAQGKEWVAPGNRAMMKAAGLKGESAANLINRFGVFDLVETISSRGGNKHGREMRIQPLAVADFIWSHTGEYDRDLFSVIQAAEDEAGEKAAGRP